MATNELKALTEIFNNTIFRIPDYQRGYAWGEEQLKEFWEDLQNLDLERVRYHYTGLLTIDNINKEYVKSLENWKDDLWVFERGFESFYIIDGQQRLITIIVLIKVIIDRFDDDETINFYKKNDLRKRFLYEKVGRCRSFIFGYEKDDPSDQYFRTRILGQHS